RSVAASRAAATRPPPAAAPGTSTRRRTPGSGPGRHRRAPAPPLRARRPSSPARPARSRREPVRRRRHALGELAALVRQAPPPQLVAGLDRREPAQAHPARVRRGGGPLGGGLGQQVVQLVAHGAGTPAIAAPPTVAPTAITATAASSSHHARRFTA